MQALGPKEINEKTVRHSVLCQLLFSYVIYSLSHLYRFKDMCPYASIIETDSNVQKEKLKKKPWGAKWVNKNTTIVFYVKVTLI